MNKKAGTIVLGISLAAVLVVSYILYAGLTRNGKAASSLPGVSSSAFFAGTSSTGLTPSSAAQRIVSAMPSAPAKAVSSAPQSAEKAPGSSAAESVNPKDLAPDFTVYDASGKAVKLSDFRGTPVVINFWASWCGYCREEMPDFNEVYKQYKGSVKFLFIDWVNDRETKESGGAYLKQQGYSFPAYYDLNQEAVKAYGLTGIPATFFVDRLGRYAGGNAGFTSKSQLLQGIAKIR